MPSPTQDSLVGLLEAIAELLECSLAGWRNTVTEPSANGYLFGYELDLVDSAKRAQTHTVFVETNPDDRERTGVVTLENPDDGTRVAVWVYPRDPALPALEATVFQEAATHLLARIGIEAPDPELTVMAYRPGKRAVIRVAAGSLTVFLKVVRPGRAARIVEQHRAFADAGVRVPHVLAWSEDGLIALSALAGVEAQQVVTTLPADFLDRVTQLTRTIGAIPSTASARESLVDRIDWYRERLLRARPDAARRINRICDRIAKLRDSGRRGAPDSVTIHGDLHLGQVFVDRNDPGVITGVLDIDTAGLGDPADDAAAFHAHLLVLGLHHRATDVAVSELCETLAARWKDSWRREGDPGFASRARAISATHLLGHAITPPVGQGAAQDGILLDWAAELLD